MKRLLLPLAAAAVTGLLLPAGVRPAYACFCGGSLEENVDNADVIVIGTVLSLMESSEYRGNFQALVGVDEYFKGSGPKEIAVDDSGFGSCGMIHRGSVGTSFLLFLGGEASPFTTHLCAGSLPLTGELASTASIQQAVRDIEPFTGAGMPPQDTPPTTLPSEDDFPWLAIIIGSALTATALLAASAFLLRRRLTRA